ncbi:Cro/C1-type HTH DNA-binding domain-containing protein [Marinobacter sp. LV10R510-11A]|uniref:helix-turn-helix domain-containing protein n=1 Tax=Marinobacter sp. LV10R510-11A TaxID=1415568 RepID=UPI000BB6A779|nr:helix-turn-helix transcriptional regulator [Marinobacter sp. LV10R510-11A]SOB74551.1 Cro/C1-type HTH DNA-binding domain-containing protein [Marinobacter sp. LV10R510-11A]
MSAKDLFYSAGHEFSRAEARTYAREDLIYNVTEDLLVQMEQLSVTKLELARRLGKSRSYVTQMLSGARNMTLGSLSDVCFALGIKPDVQLPSQHSVEVEFDEGGSTTQVWEKADSLMEGLVVQVIGENIIDMRDPGQWEKVA